MPRRNFNELRQQLAARVPNFEERMAELRRESELEKVHYSQTLSQIRRARALTQVEVARRLGVSQAQVSRVENQTDLYLSTLEGYLSAVGAEIEIMACFPDGSRIPLSLTELAGSEPVNEETESSESENGGNLSQLPDRAARSSNDAPPAAPLVGSRR